MTVPKYVTGYCHKCDEQVRVLDPTQRTTNQQLQGTYSQCLNCGQEFGPLPWHYFTCYNKGRATGFNYGLDEGWAQAMMDHEDAREPSLAELTAAQMMATIKQYNKDSKTRSIDDGLAGTVTIKRYGDFETIV
jgi:hypothetical protein